MEAVSMKLILLGLLVVQGLSYCSVHAQPSASQIPAFFVFGDSLVDNGNNNYLPASLAKSNYPYNGIDFQGGATGRFCNGRTVTDVMCDTLGIPYPPPYMAPTTRAGGGVQQGVNYASAAGGILDASGANYGQRISLNDQITNFKSTSAQLQSQIGAGQTATLLAKSIASVIIGNNDYINNYFLPNTNTKNQYNTRDYNQLLLSTLDQQMTELYNSGFRKVIVFAVGPLGCLPEQLAADGTTTCNGPMNAQIQDYNAGLFSLVNQLNAKLPGSTFLFANMYDIANEVGTNGAAYGIQDSKQGCCGGGLYNGQLPCSVVANLCPDRNAYFFWDRYHPTEAVNVILGSRLYNGGTDVVSPINIQQLVNVP